MKHFKGLNFKSDKIICCYCLAKIESREYIVIELDKENSIFAILSPITCPKCKRLLQVIGLSNSTYIREMEVDDFVVEE